MIGVHTPEFPFEENINNVGRAIKEMHLVYPIALDNNYTVWDSFKNNYWRALYFIDTKGRMRYQHFGENNYEQLEKIIQQLLAETGVKDIDKEPTVVNAKGLELAAD